MIKTLPKNTSPQSSCSEGHEGALQLAHDANVNHQSVNLQSLQEQKMSDQESEPEETMSIRLSRGPQTSYFCIS